MAAPYHHLLVPTDGSELSQHALTAALELARSLGARLTALHAQPTSPLPVIGMGDALDPATIERLIDASRHEGIRILDAAASAATQAGVPFDRESVVDDLPHRAILEASGRLGCDLIVMASHGRRGLVGLLIGSETQRVLSQATVPVLVVR